MGANLLTRVRKNPLVQGLYRSLNFYASSRSLNHLQPLTPRPAVHAVTRLNLVVPTVKREHVFGGVATALRFYRQLAGLLPVGTCCRIILTEYAPDQLDLEAFPDHVQVTPQEDSPAPRQIVAAVARAGESIPVSAGDVFIATQWTTAYLIQRLLHHPAAGGVSDGCRLIYLIQDFEPGFYPFSSDYMLSESTYHGSIPQVAVFNSSFLRDYFRGAGYSFEREYCFEPVLNARLREELPGLATTAKERLILLYGRPSTPRNAFPLMVAGLKFWAAAQPPGSGWRIISLGEKHPDVPLGNGHLLRSLGKVSLPEYASLLRQGAVGVSLMLSPHPSYPPLEMAHFGLLTLTNRFGGKDLSRWHDNLYNLTECTPEGVMTSLSALCDRFLAAPGCGPAAESHLKGYLDGGEEFPFLADLARDLAC